MRRTLAASLSFVAMGLGSIDARAADQVDACIDAHTAGQVDEQDGALRRAHRRYITCSQSACPAIVQKECAALLERLNASIPRFVVRAMQNGRETTRVRVSLDGEDVEPTLTGRAILADPGERNVSVDFGELGTAQRRVVFRQGEPMQVLTFEAPPSRDRVPDAGPEGARRSSVVPLVLSGVALVAFGSFTYFGLHGLDAESDLERRCGPPCTREDLAPVRRDYLVADISLGVGVVAAGIATWLFLRPPVRTQP